MRILLTAINAKYIHSNPAVYSLAAYANYNLTEEEKKNCKIEIAEYTINHHTEAIIADIYKKKPEGDPSGFSYTFLMTTAVRLGRYSRMPIRPFSHSV